jgi:hypothetical protein
LHGEGFFFSLGIPSGPGALPVPSELIVLSNVSRVMMSARVREVSRRGSMTNGSGLSVCSYRAMGSSGGVAWVSSLSKCEWSAAIRSLGVAAVMVSGRVVLWRVEVALLRGRRPLLILRRRW